MDHSSWPGQLRAAPTLDLVTALRLAHDEAKAPMLRPTPTAAIGWTTAVGVLATGVVAAMVVAVVTVGMATPTTAAEEAAAAKAEAARLVEGVTREAVRILDEVTGAVATALGGGRGGRRDGARGRTTGYSSSLSSSPASSSDLGAVTVVPGKRQATPSLVNVSSSAERLSKLAVSGDRTMPVS